MNQLFNFNGNEVRVVSKDGEPWFVLKDVCEVLEIGNPSQVKTRLDDGVISNEVIPDSLGRTQMTSVINEDGLYDVILESRKPEAKAFRKWITSEVIPSIRKTGSYSIQQHLPQSFGEALRLLADKVEENERVTAENAQLARIIETDRPKVNFAETCMTSDRSILVREVAKLASKQGVMIGERRLFRRLREWGMFLQHRNEPTQRAMEMGLFEIKKGVYSHPDGTRDYQTPKVTVKGQEYIINRLLKEVEQEKGA
ncbi:phage antirepressor [Cohnella nanjingensis]|uniref:Phage antirepressor KilAC domain-containing protein n=1 Tax=Cohnella nanjingensis TaxID=1387779 RepID=A0A7X0RUZ9_9BACL|nr:phage antirepressor [Cohnella nanjingensis]MBB6672589.1 phage antirepressor KilAC domain-containing protein [Cohnella nanjingensis]